MMREVPFEIRDARPSDADAVQALTLAAYEEYAAVLPERFWHAYRDNLMHTLSATGDADVIVAERQGAIVGSVLLFPPGAEAYRGASSDGADPELRLLAVQPGLRGLGVGAALVDECARRARRMGAAALGLHTMDFMRAAVRLYERVGFVRAPERDFSPAPEVIVKAYRLALR